MVYIYHKKIHSNCGSNLTPFEIHIPPNVFFFNNENQGRYIIILINKLVIDAKFHKSKCHCFIIKVIHRYRHNFHCEMISPILQ